MTAEQIQKKINEMPDPTTVGTVALMNQQSLALWEIALQLAEFNAMFRKETTDGQNQE